jgi:pimeloyl-ACP methyl ester carboxylesterase
MDASRAKNSSEHRVGAGRRLPGCSSHVLVLGLAALGLVGCVLPDSRVRRLGEDMRYVPAGPVFKSLLAIRNPITRDQQTGEPLAIFIEGDGLAWTTGSQPAVDPTPRNIPMLHLMRSSGMDAVYLGRPCYWVGMFDAPCGPAYWTSHRFSTDVVAAMTYAVNDLRGEATRDVVLVGHSGGGTLAILIGQRLPGNISVITFGAVLDHEAWTSRHRVSPLSGSLNPAALQHRSVNLSEMHVFASRDETVHIADNTRYLNADGGRSFSLIEGDHLCCWTDWWRARAATVLSDMRVRRTLQGKSS